MTTRALQSGDLVRVAPDSTVWEIETFWTDSAGSERVTLVDSADPFRFFDAPTDWLVAVP